MRISCAVSRTVRCDMTAVPQESVSTSARVSATALRAYASRRLSS
jgi:hypothetical protein